MTSRALFPDPGYPLSRVRVIARGRAVYRAEGDEEFEPVRHLLGYEPFVTLCRRQGVKASDLISDIASFGGFVRSHSKAIRSQGSEDAAAVFLGNVLVSFRDDTAWVRYGERFPSAGTAEQHYEVLDLLGLLMDLDDARYRKCIEMIEGWVRS